MKYYHSCVFAQYLKCSIKDWVLAVSLLIVKTAIVYRGTVGMASMELNVPLKASINSALLLLPIIHRLVDVYRLQRNKLRLTDSFLLISLTVGRRSL